MLATTALSILSAAALAYAQDQTVSVEVGGTADAPGLTFNPSSLTATNGTVVTFRFTGTPGNHTVTQSSFDSPCTPLEGGFDSGWVFINPESEAEGTPEWNLTITDDSRPIWAYCKQIQGTHCTAGMVLAINAPTEGERTFDAFVENASNFEGDIGQEEGFLVGQGASASAGPGPIPSGDATFGVPEATRTFAGNEGEASATESGDAPSQTDSDSDPDTSEDGALALGTSGFIAAAVLVGFSLA